MKSTSEHISDEVSSSLTAKAAGELMLPTVICGVVGCVLTIILSVIGRYEGIDLWLQEYYTGEPFYMAESGGWNEGWNWVLVLVLTFGVSFTVLDTDMKWRRVMIILLACVVILLSSPVLMLWDVFWSPVMVFVGVLWSWICAFIYSCQHTMPCELLLPCKVKEVDDVDMDLTSVGAVEVDPESHPEAKYQPKEQASCPD